MIKHEYEKQETELSGGDINAKCLLFSEPQ